MKLSFIIPIFNLEGYIEDCIHSLLNQNIPHSEYEIICVNDGSTDSTLEILQKLASSFSNIVIINQENQGVSVARNIGMACAKGKYIWFVDGDDLIISNCLEQLISFMDEKSLSLIRLGMKLVNEQYELTKTDDLNNINYNLVSKDTLYSPTVCAHIYRQNIIEHNFNFNLKTSEDALFTSYYQFLYYPYYEIHCDIYYYRQRNTSVTHDKSLSNTKEIINNTFTFYNEIRKRKFFYCHSADTTYAYNNLITSIKLKYLFDAMKLPPSDFQAFYALAVKKQLYPIKYNLTHIVQKSPKKSGLRTKIHIIIANCIKIYIILGGDCNFANKIMYFFYKKNFRQQS